MLVLCWTWRSVLVLELERRGSVTGSARSSTSSSPAQHSTPPWSYRDVQYSTITGNALHSCQPNLLLHTSDNNKIKNSTYRGWKSCKFELLKCSYKITNFFKFDGLKIRLVEGILTLSALETPRRLKNSSYQGIQQI